MFNSKEQMETTKLSILSANEISEKTTRIAFQILEDNFDEDSIVFAGIADRGFVFAERLKTKFEEISNKKVDLLKLNIDKNSSSLQGTCNVDVELAKDRVVILIDDVLNSGRTLAYGLGLFLNIPLKKMRVAVLIDRYHRKILLVRDFAGLKLSTILNEHIQVELNDENPAEDAAYLF